MEGPKTAWELNVDMRLLRMEEDIHLIKFLLSRRGDDVDELKNHLVVCGGPKHSDSYWNRQQARRINETGGVRISREIP